MRWALSVLLAGLSAGLGGCAATRGTAPIEAPVVAITQVTVDFAGVYGLHSSSSAFQVEHLGPGLLDRVRVQRALLRPDGAEEAPQDLELWTQRLLVARLARQGSIVSQVEGEAPVLATAALRDVRFVSGHDTFPVVVTQSQVGWVVGLRAGPNSPSHCGDELALDLGYVHLEGNVTALPGGEVVALLHEVALLTGPDDATVALSLPDPAVDRDAFCRLLPAAFAAADRLARRDTQYELAAEVVLSAALAPLESEPEL